MNVRAEVNLMVAGRSWTIEHNSKTKLFELLLENQPFLTPAGNPVSHKNERLLFQMVAELRCFRSLDSKLSTLWLFCSAADFPRELEASFSPEDVRRMLLKDPALACTAAPNSMNGQMNEWKAMLAFLSAHELRYPYLPQGNDPEEFLKEGGPTSVKNFDRIVQILVQEMEHMKLAQRVVVANATNRDRSFIHGVMLATNRLTPMEYATAICAAECALPWAFSYIKMKDYQNAISELSLDAIKMTTFSELY